MFSKKVPPNPSEVKSEKLELRRFTDTLQGSLSRLGAGITVVGDVKGQDNIELAGSVDGGVNLEATLVVIKGGKIKGDVIAENVVVEGTIEGDIEAKQKIELRDACKVNGNLQAATIAIAEGAFFQGTVKMQGSNKSLDPVSFSEKRVDV